MKNGTEGKKGSSLNGVGSESYTNKSIPWPIQMKQQPFSFILLNYILYYTYTIWNLTTSSLNVLIVLSVNLISFPFNSVHVAFVSEK